MSTEESAALPAGRAEDLRTSTNEQIKAFFVASSHVAPIGNVAAGLVALSLLWDHVPHVRIGMWLGMVILLAARQAVESLHPEEAIARLERPGFSLDSSVLAGVVWGILPWLDPGAFSVDEVYRWICLGLAFAIGAGAMGGLSVLMGIALRVQVPLYSMVAAAFLVGGNPEVAAGLVVYMILMASDLRGTSRNLRQLMAVRVEAADLAVDAQTEARCDPLTGLLNRAGAFERIEGHRDGPPFVVMFVDLDHFKEVNDRLGHEAGDHVLVETARRIQGAMRPEDVVARLGGDEFLVVFDRGNADLDVVTRRVLAEVERPVRFGAEEAKISASIGVTVVDEPGWTTSMLLRQADHALYEAKRAGRQRIVWFDDQLAGELEERTTLARELREAVDTGGIEIVAQPVFDLADGTVRSVEVTPRWTLPTGNQVPTTVFLPLAEELGLIDALTRSILGRAARARVQWRNHPILGSASITVRVVASRLVRGGLAVDVATVFRDQALVPGELQLMLIETAEIRDPVVANESINAMRAMGVGVVLGEFGSGKSALRDVLRLPIDVVSVHPGLIKEAPGAPRLQKLLAGLEHAAAGLGLRLAADGVDTPEQLETVRAVGFSHAQGDALCPPLDLGEIEATEDFQLTGSVSLGMGRSDS